MLFVNGVSIGSQTSIRHGYSKQQAERAETNAYESRSNPTESGHDRAMFRIGAGPGAAGAVDGSSGLVGYVDEVFVYGTALTVDELDYLYRAAQVNWSSKRRPLLLVRICRRQFSVRYYRDEP